MYGIEKLKEATLVSIIIWIGFKERLADKKLKLGEILSMLPKFWGIKDIVENADVIWEEIKDLDHDESEELGTYVCEKLGIPSDKVQSVIKKAMAWLVASKELAEAIADALKDDE